MAESRFSLPFEPNLHSSREYWSGLSRPVQVSVIAVVVAFIVCLIVMVGYLTRPRMEPLFRGMEPQQAREVTERLEEMGVPYELDGGGTVILVPAEQQDRLRLQLSPDLYAKGMGFSVFEQDGLMISDHDRRKQWQVVQQDELARTISSIDAVQWARVHLVLPEEGVFIRDRAKTTASVFLNLRPLTTLTEQQVRGISSFLAGSVINLEPEDITIVDDKGNVLYDGFMPVPDGSQKTVEANERMLAQQDFEKKLEEKLRKYLEIVFGEGNVVAMVSAELDFDITERTSITYEPEPVIRALHRIQESEEGTAPALDVDEVGEPNIPGYEAPYLYHGDYSREYLEETINYEISEIQEYVAAAQGGVQRLSATVIINRDEETEFIGEDVTTLVAAAIGHNPERGDVIAVQAMPFDTTAEDLRRQQEAAEQLQRMIMYGILVGVALLLIIIALVYLRRRTREETAEEEEIQEGFDIGELLQREEPEELEDDIREKVRKVADAEPENVAYLLRTWLSEE